MINIIFWGRGGEGAKTASHILAEAAFSENKEVQAFPEYGPERSGAPMRSYVKISDTKIKNQSSITIADYIIFIDGSLIKQTSLEKDIFKNANKNTKFIVNSKTIQELNYSCKSINASEISIKYFGKDFSNIVLLGALVKLTGVVKLESL